MPSWMLSSPWTTLQDACGRSEPVSAKEHATARLAGSYGALRIFQALLDADIVMALHGRNPVGHAGCVD